MKKCEWSNCPNWAQWHAMTKVEGKPPAEWPRRRLCAAHKEAHEIAKIEPKAVYMFIGAEPSGLNAT
jgi:hypothetical protein